MHSINRLRIASPSCLVSRPPCRAAVGRIKRASPINRIPIVAAANTDDATDTGLSLDPTAPALLTSDDIVQILPHRYPFLFVDRVTQIEEEKSIVGLKQVTVNDNFFVGHFPNRAIMPGVLQIEAMAQLIGILVLRNLDASAKEKFFFAGLDKCKWKKPVVPGDTLMLRGTITKFNKSFGIVKAKGEAFVNGGLVCTAELTLAVTK